MTDLIPLSLLGGLVALDATSVGQFMISRPVVAAVLTGWLVGDPALGLLTGGLLEFYLLVSFPSGGGRFPEGSTASVVAVASAASVDVAGALPLGVAVGLVWGQLGGWSISALRSLNGRLVPERGDLTGSARVAGVHLAAVSLDFLRAVLLTTVGVLLGRWVTSLAAPLWPLGVQDSRGLLLLGAAASGGIFLRSLGGFRRRRLVFAGGLVLGIIGGRLL